MKFICAVLLGLVAMATAHWQGYPFKGKNDGKYGKEYPYANYGNAKTEAAQPKVAVKSTHKGEGYDFAPYYHGYGLGYGYGFPYGVGYHGYYGGYNQPHNHEFDYRQFGGYPVHLGGGQFQFLGVYGGNCHADYNYGFYFTDDYNSFVMCDHGRAHRFQCPKGTANRGHGHFKNGHAYGMRELCGVNKNAAH